MNKDNNDSLRSLFREKFSDYKIESKGPEWSDIEKEIDNVSKPDSGVPFLYYAVGIAATLLLVLMLTLYSMEPSQNEETFTVTFPENEAEPSPNNSAQHDPQGSVSNSMDQERGNEMSQEPAPQITESIHPSEAVRIERDRQDLSSNPKERFIDYQPNIYFRSLNSFYITDPGDDDIRPVAVAATGFYPAPGSSDAMDDNGTGTSGKIAVAVSERDKGFLALNRISVNLQPNVNFHTITPFKNDLTFIDNAQLPPRLARDRMGFHGSVSADFKLTDKLALHSGIGYTYRTYFFEYKFTDYFTLKNGNSTIDETVRNIGFNVGLRGKVVSYSSLNQFLNGGLELQNAIGTSGSNPKQSLVLKFGYEFEYPAGNRVSVSVQPTYSYLFSRSTFTHLHARSYWIGVQVSLNRVW